MGAKGSSAPAPDPRLVEAQIQSMNQQNDMLGRVVSNAESMQPLQREQTQFALDTGRQAVRDAQADRDWMLTRRAMLSGVQDKIVAQANDFNERARTDELAREAQADATAAISRARESSAREMARRGVSPFSGGSRSADARLILGEAALTAGTGNMARRAARQESLALTDRANNTLAGYPAMTMSASGQGANIAAGGVNVANAGATGQNAGFVTAADIAGRVGTNATSMFGAQASYKNAQDQIAASSDPFNTILGAAAGVGTSYALSFLPKPSDPRLKTDVKPAGMHEATGLHLYEFAYLNDPSGKRYRGVMADEVQMRFPKAVHYDDLGFASVDYAMLGIEMKRVH